MMAPSANKKTRLLITGASGFIGSQLARIAAEAGYEVTATAAANNAAERGRIQRLEAAGIKVLVASLQDGARMTEVLRGQQAVVHLAAAQHEANVAESYFYQINVEGTQRLLEASRAAGVERFVYGSTIGVYGSALNGSLDENSCLNPANPYSRSKVAAEQLVRQFNGALQTTIVRIAETYGPEDFRLLKLFKAVNRGTFVMIGSGLNRHHLIHVEDLSRGLLQTVEHPAAIGQTFILADREALTTWEMVAGVAAALGRQPPRVRLPLWPFLFTAVALESTLTPLGIQPPLHRRRLDFFATSFVFCTAKAESVLGFKAEIPFAQGARNTAAWYRTQGYLNS